MGLVTSKGLLEAARDKQYAVCGFAFHNLELLQAVVAGAERMRAPVILQTTPATIEAVGLNYLVHLARAAAESVSIPVVLHLDHGRDYETALRCLRAGYTSIMIDGSRLPWEENAALVKKVTEAAHAVGVPVEAELGRVPDAADVSTTAEDTYTDPFEAARFVAETGCDSLAVAIGTAHGVYRGKPRLDLDRLATIAREVPVPLVLHGASGLPDESVRQAVARGIAKINISTELKLPYATALRSYLHDHPSEADPRKYVQNGKRAVQKVVEEKLRLSGSAGRAEATATTGAMPT
ncbi:class II fructose-bisphosphate aldolase [Polycladomyces subterraneus]|uniref:Class II fructose-bisphosphate aldolase n=1 Tax=Polycladomyces subterraneus TaxID=1016997 RepID=A0ABT8IPW9_9BACL|nr:class II fructose-bisphosphate aldolase [Polycladomyces subterraneus]MDN4594834.1 class II fructose-bisphosphate aldolase [Polycladomyces subterraneus]